MKRDPGEVKKRKSSESAHVGAWKASPEQGQSQPLVALVPAQKRSAKDQGVSETLDAFKVREVTGVLKPIARHAWSAEKSIRGQHSAPDQRKSEPSAGELRGSKSAPDLRAPVLAAIQALKDGTIQVDERTRAKIAQAARRVLDAREACQRLDHSQGLEIAALRTVPDAVPVRNLHQQAEVPSVSEPLHLDKMEGSCIQMSEASPTVRLSLVNQNLTVEPRAKSYPFTVTSGLPRFPNDLGREEVKAVQPIQLTYGRSRSTVLPMKHAESDLQKALDAPKETMRSQSKDSPGLID